MLARIVTEGRTGLPLQISDRDEDTPDPIAVVQSHDQLNGLSANLLATARGAVCGGSAFGNQLGKFTKELRKLGPPEPPVVVGILACE